MAFPYCILWSGENLTKVWKWKDGLNVRLNESNWAINFDGEAHSEGFSDETTTSKQKLTNSNLFLLFLMDPQNALDLLPVPQMNSFEFHEIELKCLVPKKFQSICYSLSVVCNLKLPPEWALLWRGCWGFYSWAKPSNLHISAHIAFAQIMAFGRTLNQFNLTICLNFCWINADLKGDRFYYFLVYAGCYDEPIEFFVFHSPHFCDLLAGWLTAI